MSMISTRLKVSASAIALASLFSGTAMAAMVFDRGLPDADLNNAAGANRSNVAWGFGDNSPDPAFYSGDDFMIGGTGTYRIDTIRTWAVIGPTSDTSGNLLADRYLSITLFGGIGNTLSSLKSGNTVGNSTDNPDISITKVTYPGGSTTYQGSSGADLNLFEIEFNNLNWTVNGGDLVYFSVAGVDNPADSDYRPWFMHASNATLGGVQADGADNLYSAFFASGPTLTFDSTFSSLGNGWDKASDINVQVEATRVPEPASLALVAVALLGAARVRRRKT